MRLKVNLVVESSKEERVKAAEIIKKNLEEIGIRSYNNSEQMTGTYENYLRNKNYDIILTGVTVRNKP